MPQEMSSYISEVGQTAYRDLRHCCFKVVAAFTRPLDRLAMIVSWFFLLPQGSFNRARMPAVGEAALQQLSLFELNIAW